MIAAWRAGGCDRTDGFASSLRAGESGPWCFGPITAAVAHTFATAVVIFNSARLFRFGEERTAETAAYVMPMTAQPAAA